MVGIKIILMTEWIVLEVELLAQEACLIWCFHFPNITSAEESLNTQKKHRNGGIRGVWWVNPLSYSGVRKKWSDLPLVAGSAAVSIAFGSWSQSFQTSPRCPLFWGHQFLQKSHVPVNQIPKCKLAITICLRDDVTTLEQIKISTTYSKVTLYFGVSTYSFTNWIEILSISPDLKKPSVGSSLDETQDVSELFSFSALAERASRQFCGPIRAGCVVDWINWDWLHGISWKILFKNKFLMSA